MATSCSKACPASPKPSPSRRSPARCTPSFARFQFTPDLLPADLVGTMVYHPQATNFEPKLGPIFNNLILADEINRAPAKVQSALLEAMQERQVTLGDHSYPLPEPFLVLATQNPIDQEGTYQLPEAQLDRFLLKVTVGYPTQGRGTRSSSTAWPPPPRPTRRKPSPARSRSPSSRELVNEIYIDPAVRKYIVQIIHTTRFPSLVDAPLKNLVRAGASPRGTINLALTARALAFMHGRAFVTPQDVKDMAHRRPAPPDPPHLRGRGRGNDHRLDHRAHHEQGAGALTT